MQKSMSKSMRARFSFLALLFLPCLTYGNLEQYFPLHIQLIFTCLFEWAIE